jgi:hypothetical protein
VEKGTFAIRGPLAALLYDHFGIGWRPRHHEAGGLVRCLCGAGGGNPRFKTALESLHSLRHTAMASLPGQVGRNRDALPDEHAALVRYAEATEESAPAARALCAGSGRELRSPVLLWQDFVEATDRTSAIINSRRDHRLEAGASADIEVVQYLVGQQLLDEEQFPPCGSHRHRYLPPGGAPWLWPGTPKPVCARPPRCGRAAVASSRRCPRRAWR